MKQVIAFFILSSSIALAQVPATQPAGTVAQATGTYEEKIPGTLISFTMVKIPAGKVKVGDKEIQIKPFWIERTETTWDEFDVFAQKLDLSEKEKVAAADAKSRPSNPYGAPDRGYGHHGYPAISLSYLSAQSYCKWLSAKTGKKYRLPTEAEWQYACQANSPEPTDKAKFAWYEENSDDKTHPVAKKEPNPWGLYDMLGNAGEWCTDSEGKGVLCGGMFLDAAEDLNCTHRAYYQPSWQVTDPQNPKGKWWFSDGPFCGLRVIRDE
jgi:formylglycine-generating enzyme required for sulfatase activity